MASSSSLSRSWLYHVFLSFRGEDDVAGIAGYDFGNCDSEADLINKVASDVTAVLGFTPSKDFDNFVGIEPRIIEIKSKLILQSEEVKVIGILGPAGIGKTTTARVLYNRLSPGFPFSTFLENIRGNYEKPCGNDYQLKLSLQKKLLVEILNQKDIEVCHLGVVQEMLSGKKVLVVLDEVDCWWQLEEMETQREWLGPGSMIIITTEDRKLLNALGLGIEHIYKMEFPTSDESLQIFCQYAFGQHSPDYGFEELVREVTWLAGNLPLGLRVMGSYLRGMSREQWIDALPRLRSSLDREIDATLRFSYDGLSDKDKALFLHIACFFSCSLWKGTGNVLALSLIDFSDNSEDEECSENSKRGKIQISKSAFDEMNNLQFLKVISDNFSAKFLVELIMQFSKFEKLWDGIKPLHCLKLIDLSYSEYLKEIPDLSKATSLEKLDLVGCKSLLKLTSSIGNATKLKKCDLSGCLLLKELPSSISRLINLEELNLSYCLSLKALSVFSSLEKLSGCSSLKDLFLIDTAIEKVPSSMSTWSCLYRLDMTNCRNLKEFPNVPDSIEELVLCSTGIEEVPPQIEKLFRLRKLIMYGCKKLKTISPNISKLDNLEFLGLRKDGQGEYDRERVDEFGLKLFEAVIKWGPDLNHSWELRSDFKVHHILPICLPKKAFTSPVSLCLRCVGLKTIPDCIGFLSGLSELDITECRKLRALPQLPAYLISLDAQNCESLESIDSSSFQNPNICLDFASCFNLNQEARRLIQTSACTYALLPGRKVPAHFTHQATSGCLTINLSPKSLPSSFRFRACILVPTDSWHYSVPANGLSCNVSGKQNDLTVEYGTNHIHHMPDCESALVEGVEVPADFTHQATSGSLMINITPGSLPSSVRFKACILLSRDKISLEDYYDDDNEEGVSLSYWRLYNNYDDEEDENGNLLMRVSCSFMGEQNGLTVSYGSNKHDMPYLYGFEDHLYTFEDSFCLDQDFPEATFSSLMFQFEVCYENWKIKACGVQLLRDEENADDDDGGRGSPATNTWSCAKNFMLMYVIYLKPRNRVYHMESILLINGTVKKQKGDFGKVFDETCVGKTEEVKQVWRQALEDVAGIAGYHSSNSDSEADLINKVASDVTAVLGNNDAGFYDAGIDTNIEAKNETEEGEESGRDEDAGTKEQETKEVKPRLTGFTLPTQFMIRQSVQMRFTNVWLQQGTFTKLAKQGSDHAVTKRRSCFISGSRDPVLVKSHKWVECITKIRFFIFVVAVLPLETPCVSNYIYNDIKRSQMIGPELVQTIRESRFAVVVLSKRYASSSWCLNDLVEVKESCKKICGEFGTAFEEACQGKPEDVKQRWRESFAVESVQCFGRKKTAVAVTHCKHGCGLIKLNGCTIELFQPEILRFKIVEDMRIRVNGGGHTSQDTSCGGSEEFYAFLGNGYARRTHVLLCLLSESFNIFCSVISCPEMYGIGIVGSMDVAGIAGYHSSNSDNEAQMIDKVTSDVTAVLCFAPSKDFDDFVGIRARITEIKSKLILQSEQVQMIVLVGPAGIGKTTTATVLYNQLSPNFQFSTFLENIRGNYEKPCGNDYQLKLSLQKKLLAEILNQKDIEVRHLGVAQQRLSDKKVLVVLDEVDSWWQLEATAYQRGWVGPGSIIIITTEDRKLLKTLRLGINRINHIYEMKYPTEDESLQIFCQYAFGQYIPDNCFEGLAWEVTRLAGDLPLGLKVMGSYLRGMSRDEWIEALPRLRSSLDREIESTLRFSYDGLSDKDQALFLHIACFFSCSLWNGTGKVLGIYLTWGRSLQISKGAFDGMNNLRFLNVYYGPLCMPEGLNCFPDKLRFIRWPCCPLRFWPSKFSFKFLVELHMYDSKFEKLWEGIQPLPCLKLMDLNTSRYLKEIPDLSKATSLERLYLCHCESLLELTSSIGSAAELELYMRHTAIEELPSSISTWSCLYKLSISGCKNIKDFPNVPDSIVELNLSKTGIEEVPPWIEKLFRLRKLSMFGCEKLKTISPNISKLENLEVLALSRVYRWDEDPEYYDFINYNEAIIEWGSEMKRRWSLETDFDFDYILPICLPEKALTSPISLRFGHEGFETIPNCIRRLSGLINLDITECSELVALPQLPGSLLSIDAHGCESLKSIDSSSFQNPNICLDFARCFNLNQEARKLIQTSACKYALLPGEEVPAHFTHQATSGCLTINMAPTPLPSSFRFKACILLSKGNTDLADHNDEDKNSFTGISCRIGGKQNGHTVPYGSDQLHRMPVPYLLQEHLYIFEDSFSLNQDCPEAEEATFNELFFKFRVHDEGWKVKGCGVRLLEEVPQCILDGKETEDEECRGINIEANNENAGDEDKEKEDDDNSGEGAEDEVDEGVDVEEDIDGNDAGFSDAGMDINIEANNETEEEGEESGRDVDSETMIRKRKSLGLGSSENSLITMMKRMRIH
ncbi:hypothetical protein F2Q69_00019005 [Brassica cretica]|uniref:ADP-ribosyl cyclase/cyclic ADP-ribose hydrolase n=1 Tax=Brassica cretica TaxID=69181 RepID=A0A8S9Q959_BRACR|nr:hypothetical protein F2Q69_00019005 [Brassica cretica]